MSNDKSLYIIALHTWQCFTFHFILGCTFFFWIAVQTFGFIDHPTLLNWHLSAFLGCMRLTHLFGFIGTFLFIAGVAFHFGNILALLFIYGLTDGRRGRSRRLLLLSHIFRLGWFHPATSFDGNFDNLLSRRSFFTFLTHIFTIGAGNRLYNRLAHFSSFFRTFPFRYLV